MDSAHIERAEIGAFSSFSVRFQNQEQFSAFLSKPFLELSDLGEQIARKKENYSLKNRSVLVSTLEKQLKDKLSACQIQNLKILSEENTFTITTGHQLSLFAGPLFFVYKILHVVKLCEEFNDNQSAHKLVPIFWLASEDHDFDEVKSTNLFGKQFSWETEQKGAVGRFNLADFEAVFSEFSSLFEGKETAIQDLLKIERNGTYAEYMQKLVSKLFEDFGVLVLNPDDAQLKSLFLPIMEKEIKEFNSLSKVEEMNTELEKHNTKPQAQAREINLFYLGNQQRTKIERNGNDYLLGQKQFSQSELLNLLRIEPQNISPNVILRPVYQETILPNLCYVGGGGEMAYWIQLKKVFQNFGVLFPLLQQRNSLHLVDAGTQKRLSSLPFEIKEYFSEANELKKSYLNQNAETELDFSEIASNFSSLTISLETKVNELDPSLEQWLGAELARMRKQLEGIEQRFSKQVKTKHEQALKNIEFVSERFLPNRELQERYFHWLHFTPTGDFKSLFSEIYSEIKPFDGNLKILYF